MTRPDARDVMAALALLRGDLRDLAERERGTRPGDLRARTLKLRREIDDLRELHRDLRAEEAGDR